MKQKISIYKKMVVVALVAFLYGFYRIIRLSSSCSMFFNDPFYLNNIRLRIGDGIIAQSDFLKLLLYMNFNFFLILFFSLMFIILSVFLFQNRHWAKKIMFYLSSFLLVYTLIEPSFFPWMKAMDIQEIISTTSTLDKLAKMIYHYDHILIYPFFIITCYPFRRIWGIR